MKIENLIDIDTVADLTGFMQDNYYDLQQEFYGNELNKDVVIGVWVKIFGTIWIRESENPVVQGLLLWFASVFERWNQKGLLKEIINNVQESKRLYALMQSIFLYKYITSADQYAERFYEIIQLLESVYKQYEDARTRILCENIIIEYFAKSFIKTKNTAIKDLCEINKSALLNSARVKSLWKCKDDEFPHEYAEATIRVAENFYDEANVVLSTFLVLEVPLHKEMFHVCPAHGCHCPSGLHKAKECLATKYSQAYQRTGVFVKQALTSKVYTAFDDYDKCMRYLRQYMWLHMPQIKEAVTQSLRYHCFGEDAHIRVLDVGAGPGTLYCVLAAMLANEEQILDGYSFEYCPLDPSKEFLDFFNVIAENVQHDRLKVGVRYNLKIDQMQVSDLRNIDWIFLCNAVTPMVASTPNIGEVAKRITDSFAESCGQLPLVTIAENSKTDSYEDFCQGLQRCGLKKLNVAYSPFCDGSWLGGCAFFVTKMSNHRPGLKLGCFTK